jgi:hypothetical protein
MVQDRTVFLRRRTGILAIIAAPFFWFCSFAFGLANQMSFFSMEEYLQQPMWTEYVPQPLGSLHLVTTVILTFVNVALLAVGIAGIIMLFTKFRPAAMFKIVLWIFGLITLDMVAYEALASVGYYLAKHRLPSHFGDTLQACAAMVGVLAAISALFWLSGRRLSHPAPLAAV